MPNLYVLGGANGVGKTTWYYTGVEQGYISKELPFINVDQIAINELGGYEQEKLIQAEQIARERMKMLISESKDFMIESNLAKGSDYDWIAAMRKQGYDVTLFFLGTNNVEINKLRVQQRVIDGGHDIAEFLIEHRRNAGLSYLKSKIMDFKEARLIDVSGDTSKEMATLKQGRILFRHDQMEEWIKQSLEITEKLEQKLKISDESETTLEQRNKGHRHHL